MENIKVAPKRRKDRSPGEKYLFKDKVRIWSGKASRWYCEHNRATRTCKECGGSSICEHNRERYHCKECGGGGICEHNRRRSSCKECGGSSVCEHNRLRSRCKECGGGAICEHNRRRSSCKECGGREICEHNRQRGSCKICSPNSNYFCELCHYITGTKRFVSKENKYVKICADCFYKTYPDEKKVPTRYKRKQHYIHEKLKEKYGEDFFQYDKTIECGCSRKIPDWFRDCFKFALNLECDEDQHKWNTTSCENKRLVQLFLDCANRPFICLRFNPDKYINKNGEKIEGCFTFDEKNNLIVNQQEFEKRWNIIEQRIDYFLENGTKKEIELEKLFYDGWDCLFPSCSDTTEKRF